MDIQSPRFRIIWITPRFPLGAPDGARHATRSLIHHLTQLHAGIDLICIIPEGESADNAAAKQQLDLLSCSIISRSRSKLLRFPTLATPFTFRTFTAPKVRQALKERLDILLEPASPSHEAFMIFDGLHPIAALSESDLHDLSRRCRGIVYRAHNFEAALWEQCAEQARMPWFRWFLQYQARLVRNFERRIARSVSLIAPVSEEDAARFRGLAPGANISITQIGMDFPDEKSIQPARDSAKFELLFIGRLDWIPNRNGLIWFLEKIWPTLIARRRKASLKVAGVGDGRWLQRFRNLPGVEYLGRVDDIQPLYASCALSVAPLFQGSGTRVKIIESARYGRPVLTTALGAEGTGLDPAMSYFRAETQQEWLAQLESITINDCRKVGLMAFRSLRERFDGKAIAQRFVQKLDSITTQHLGPHLGRC